MTDNRANQLLEISYETVETFDGHNSIAQDGGRVSGWQSIIWREWRNAEDEEYAQHLFNLVASEPIGLRNQAIIALLGLVFGALVGMFVDLLLLPAVSALFVWIGGIIGGIGGYALARRLSMRHWLATLTPNNIFTQLNRFYKIALVAGIGLILFFTPSLWPAGLFLGFSAGLLLGLVLGLVSWPFLGIFSLIFFQGELLTGADILLSWGSVGVGLGIGVLPGARPNHKHEYSFRKVCFWWAAPPPISKLNLALQQASQAQSAAAAIWKRLVVQLQKEGVGLERSPEIYRDMLRHAGWEKRFMARQALITLGAEAIEVLKPEAQKSASRLQQTALALLRGIEQDTIFRLAEQMARPACTRCMLRCKEYLVSVSPEISFTYLGCRVCRQSRDIADGEIVAVLDSTMAEAWTVEDGVVVRVNWLKRRELFDFDRVEIIQATDEDTERFAVQVGNDTDIVRRPQYKQIPCLVNPACELTENTLRVLDRIFGQVERKQKMPNQLTEKADARYI